LIYPGRLREYALAGCRLEDSADIADAEAWDALAKQYQQQGKRGAGGADLPLSEAERKRLSAAGISDRALQV
jgi:hypothetical protein